MRPNNPYRGPIRCVSPITRFLLEKADRDGVCMTEIAQAMNIHASSVRNWRSGRTSPTILAVEELAAFLKVELNVTN